MQLVNKAAIFIFLSMLCMQKANGSFTSDADITYEIKQTIAQEHVLGVDYINIKTKNGIVYLEGKVETSSQATKIVQIAQSAEGVKDVNTSKLYVAASNAPFTDLYITAKVKGLFVRERLFGEDYVEPWRIKVETKNGIVYLTGAAKTRAEADKAIKLAKSVVGVKQVQSKIELKS